MNGWEYDPFDEEPDDEEAAARREADDAAALAEAEGVPDATAEWSPEQGQRKDEGDAVGGKDGASFIDEIPF